MRTLALFSLVVFTACGGSSTPAAEAPATETAAAKAPAAGSAEPAAESAATDDASDKKIPEACTGDAGSCTMPRAFVKKLCAGVYPELALMFFVKGTPWRR